MAIRATSRQRMMELEAPRRQSRAIAVVRKLHERERVWQYMLGAVIMLQAFIRGTLARVSMKKMQQVRVQGQLCAHQAAWKARQWGKQQLERRLMAANYRGLLELEKVRERLLQAQFELASSKQDKTLLGASHEAIQKCAAQV